jgi:hypothetical protein
MRSVKHGIRCDAHDVFWNNHVLLGSVGGDGMKNLVLAWIDLQLFAATMLAAWVQWFEGKEIEPCRDQEPIL